jgi:methylenetetrahydrofolate dehydrogenase (NADP+)/methenyltetrahydrofolate cyclohydrolase
MILNGKKFASEREKVLKNRVSRLGFVPKMVSVFFAEDSGSVLYTNLKQATAKRIGIEFHAEKVSVKDDVNEVLDLVRKYSSAKDIHGVMIQKPSKKVFFEQVDTDWAASGMLATMAKNLKYFVSSQGVGKGSDEWWRRLTSEISPARDVDCLTQVNLDLVYRGRWKILPATVRAVLSILEHTRTVLVSKKSEALPGKDSAGTVLAGKRVVVVGRSEIVGKPLAHVLAQSGFRVVLCGSEGVAAESVGSQMIEVHEPRDLASAVFEAEIVVSATGRPGIITGDIIKRGAVVIDVGSPIGDVDFDSVKLKAGFITPVPGGVGPVTVVSLLENLVELVS